MDHIDEQTSPLTEHCFTLYEPFNCDERLCLRRYYWSCGDGQCIESSVRLRFFRNDQSINGRNLCFNLRNFYYICELYQREPMMTQPSGMCTRLDPLVIEDRKLNDETYSQSICTNLFICYIVQAPLFLCPCTSSQDCYKQLTESCPQQIRYPWKPLIAPYLYTFVIISDHVQVTEYRLKGRIKCREHQIEFSNYSFKLSDYDEIKLDLTYIEYHLCSNQSRTSL